MYTATQRTCRIVVIAVLLMASRLHAASAEDQYKVAATHYSHGQWQSAADEFKVFLDQFPHDARRSAAMFFLGETLVQLQRYDDATRQFSDLLASSPQDRNASQASFRIAEIAFFQGKYKEARQRLSELKFAAADDPRNAHVLAYLGEIALAQSDGAAAEGFYRKAIEKFGQGPLESECRFGMARSLELQGQTDEAIRFYQFLVDNHRGTLIDDAQLQIGVLKYRKGAVQEAIVALESFKAAFPESELRADAGYWHGVSLLALHKNAEAAAVLRDAADAADQTSRSDLAPAIRFSWSDALRKSGDESSANAQCQMLLDKWPDSPWGDDACQALADAALRAGQFDRAEELGRLFAAKYGGSSLRPYISQTLGRVLLKRERYAEAASVFQALLADGAKSPDGGANDEKAAAARAALNRASAYYLALALIGDGRYDAAIKALDPIQPLPDETDLQGGMLVARASALIGMKQYADAVEPLRRYLAIQPQGPDAAESSARLCVSLAESGDLAGAVAVYENFRGPFRNDPLFLPTTEYLAERLLGGNQPGKARELFTVLSENGNPPDFVAKGLKGVGRTQMKSGTNDNSAKPLARLLQQSPEESQAAEAARLRARSLEAAGQAAEAVTAYCELAARFPKSPQAPSALDAAAQIEERQGHKTEALALVDQLLARYPTCEQRPAALYQKAWIFSDTQRQSEAAAVFRTLAESHPKTKYGADAMYRLAELAAQSRDFTGAIKWLDQLVASSGEPDVRAHAIYLRGKTEVDQQHWSEALPVFERLDQEFPGHSLCEPAEYWIAESLFQLGRYDDSYQVLERLEAKVHERSESWVAMVPLRRAQILAQKGEWDKAAELAETLPKRFPNFRQKYEIDYLLGRCLSSQARFAEARQAYERVIRSPSGSHSETAAMAQWMIGETYFHQKQYAEAIDAYLRVENVYAFPKWQAAALLQAGKCHELNGQQGESAKVYSQLVKEFPDTQFAKDAAERLKAFGKLGNASTGQNVGFRPRDTD